jgi:hypothetical protein
MCFRTFLCFFCGVSILACLLSVVLIALGPFQLQYANVPSPMAYKDDVRPCQLKEDVRVAQVQLITDLLDQFTQHGITYWATETTLLHAILFHEWTNFADTITFAVMKADLAPLLRLRPLLEQNGKAKLMHTSHGYIYCKNNLSHYPCIDIRIMSECNGEIALCTPTNELSDCTFDDSIARRREVFPTMLIFPLSQVTVSGRVIPIPADSEKCLQALFGLEWKQRLFVDPLNLIRNRFTFQLCSFLYAN